MSPETDASPTLQQRIESAMRDSMRARDELRTQTLRMAMAAAHNQRIARGRELTDDEVVEVIGRQVKQRRESIAMYRDAGREDRAAGEEAEAAILAEFLPQQLSEAEIETLVRDAIAETGASAPGEMGRVMGHLSPRTKGRADGRLVSDIGAPAAGGRVGPRCSSHAPSANRPRAGVRRCWRALIIVAVVAAALFMVLSANITVGQENLEVGQLAPRDIRAPA